MFRDNKPFDQIVSSILTASGSPYQNGPANFYRVGNKPEDWCENAAQVFLGVRIQCARCHHPFENISQTDFYGMVAFFARVGSKASEEFGVYGRDSVIYLRDSGETKHPRTNQNLPPTPLGAAQVTEGVDRRQGLADWLSDPNNPALARNLVNRYWGYLLGRGLVDPIDDLRTTNPAACEEVLDFLAHDLIEHHYDLKHLLKRITTSRVYQLDATIHPDSVIDAENKYCTRYTTKRLPAEVLLDAINTACGTQDNFRQLPEGYRAIALPDADVPNSFLDLFGRPQRAMTCECERIDTPNMAQALQFISGDFLNRKISDKKGRINQFVTAKTPLPDAIKQLYLVTLSRHPDEREQAVALELVRSADSEQIGLEDLLWTLLNSREFQFNH